MVDVPIQVSVIIPTYNRRDWVQIAIDSVLVQQDVSFECIVVDDGSTDGTDEALKERFGEAIRYFWQENQGESAARNYGAALARGKYLAFLDSDDLWKPDKLKQQLQFLEKDPKLAGVYCLASGITAEGKSIPRRAYGAQFKTKRLTLPVVLKKGLPLGGSTLMIRRNIFVDVGGYDITIQHGEDVDFCYQLLANQYTIGILKKPLTLIRSHSQSQSLTFDEHRFLAAYQDLLKVYSKLWRVLQNDTLKALVQQSVLRQHLRMVLFYLYQDQQGQAEKYRRLIRESDPGFLQRSEPYYRLIAYFTPFVFSIRSNQEDVLTFLKIALAERNTNNGKPDGEEDSLLVIKTVVWCAIRGSREERSRALRLILEEISSSPKVLFHSTLWLYLLRFLLSPLIAKASNPGE